MTTLPTEPQLLPVEDMFVRTKLSSKEAALDRVLSIYKIFFSTALCNEMFFTFASNRYVVQFFKFVRLDSYTIEVLVIIPSIF